MLSTISTVNPALLWLGAGAILLAIEAVTGSGWLLWAAASAGVMALVTGAVPGVSTAVALSGFAGLTLVSTFLARRLAPRPGRPASPDINDNLARLVGHRGRAVAGFENGSGRVFIDGKEWAADQDGPDAPQAGAGVVVTGVAGAHLKVRSA